MAKQKKQLPARADTKATKVPEKIKAAQAVTEQELTDYASWLHTPPDFKNYRSIREHVQKMMHFHKLGLLDKVFTNAQTYMVSALIISRDREEQFDKNAGDDLENLLVSTGGEIELTSEQCLTIMQTQTDAAKIKLMTKFHEQNQQVKQQPMIVDAEITKPIEEQYAFGD